MKLTVKVVTNASGSFIDWRQLVNGQFKALTVVSYYLKEASKVTASVLKVQDDMQLVNDYKQTILGSAVGFMSEEIQEEMTVVFATEKQVKRLLCTEGRRCEWTARDSRSN